MFKKLLPALLLSITASAANATVVDYTMTIERSFDAFGQFAGTDSNTDGFLSLDELSAFTFDVPAAAFHIGLGVLSDFGRYDIVGNTWLHDAAGWGNVNFAYFSFNGGSSSANPVNAGNVVTRVVQVQAPAEVPEPAPVALSALGLLALGAARRRRK